MGVNKDWPTSRQGHSYRSNYCKPFIEKARVFFATTRKLKTTGVEEMAIRL